MQANIRMPRRGVHRTLSTPNNNATRYGDPHLRSRTDQGQPHISFEHLVFLVSALAQGEELTLANCEECGALTVGERISCKARRCLHCAAAQR